MIRLWNQVGVFRILAVAMLVMSVVGGAELASGQQSQQHTVTPDLVAQSERDEMQELKADRIERARASAVSRAAMREAQAKADTAAAIAAAQAKAAEDAVRKPIVAVPPTAPVARPPTTPGYGPIPASCAAYSGNRGIGCAVLLQVGFGLDQMPCLDKLFTRESSWNPRAANPSGAYGIPQALPGSKMASAGPDWQTNPATQIRWGLGYIKGRYSTPCGAWAHSEATGWY